MTEAKILIPEVTLQDTETGQEYETHVVSYALVEFILPELEGTDARLLWKVNGNAVKKHTDGLLRLTVPTEIYDVQPAPKPF